MPRLLFFACFLCAASLLRSGNLALTTKSGNPIDGQTIDLWGDINTSLLKLEFDALNTGVNTHTSRMKKVEIFEVPGTFNIFCWDVCYLEDSIIVSTGTVTLAPNATWLWGATDYYPQGQMGTTTVKYVIWNVSNPNDSSWFIVNYHITGLGIDHPALVLAPPSYPNPSNGDFIIPFIASGNEEVKVVLATLSGTITREFITEWSDALAVPGKELEPGIYICSVYLRGALIATVRQTIVR